MKLSEFGVRRPFFTVKIFVAISILDLMSLRLLPVERFPKMEMPTMAPITSYPGVSAEHIETKVTHPSDQVATLEGLEGGENLVIVGHQMLQNGSPVHSEVGE